MSDDLDDLIKKRRAALAQAPAPKDALDQHIAERRVALQAPESQHTPGEKFMTGIAQGASMGFGKKILGGIDAANKMLPRALGGESAPLSDFGKNYTATRDRIGGIEDELIREHPVAGRVIEGAAGALPLLLGGAATGVAKAASLPARMAIGARTGAGIGALGGTGHATGGVRDYMNEMGTGALIGGVIGGAAPPVMDVASLFGGKALTTLNLRPSGRSAAEIAQDANYLRSPTGPEAGATPLTAAARGNTISSSAPTNMQRVRASFGQAVERGGIESTKTRALRELSRSLEHDNVNPADAVSFAQRNAQKPIAVLDLGQGNVSGLARLAKDVPGLGRRMIPDLLHGRSAGRGPTEGATLSRVLSDFEKRIGLAPEDYYATLDDMAARQKAQASTDYGAIRGKVIDDPEALSLFNEPEFQAIHERLRANARLGGKEQIPTLASKEEIGGETVRSQNPQTLGTLDKMKRQLDKIVAGKSEAVGTVDRDLAYNMRQRVHAILDRMDELHPEYKAARANYRGSAEAQDAYAMGKDEFMNADPRLLQQRLSKLPEAVRDFYRRGGYDALRTRMSKMDDGANIGAWLEKNPDIRDRVAALSKTQDDASALRGDLGAERAMGERKNAILGGPNSAERLIEYAERQPRMTGMTQGGVKGIAGRAVDAVVNRTAREGSSGVMGEAAKLLTRTGEPGVKLTMEEVQALRIADLRAKLAAARRAGLVGGLGAQRQ